MVRQDFVDLVALALGIRPPVIEYIDRINTDTQMGGANPEIWRVGVRSSLAEPDQYFTVAHEMRHLWQTQHMPQAFREYRSNAVLSVKAYNLQAAEIDANGFAMLMMQLCFRITPLFNGLDETVKRRIAERAEEIARELNP